MALPVGLLPVFVFVLTVGISVPVAMGAFLFAGRGRGSFAAALRAALIEAGGLYVLGVFVVWAIAGGPELWEVAVMLLVTGLVAFGSLMALPLAVGRVLVQRVRSVDYQQALRATTIGWPLAMLGVFGIFIAPGGPTSGTLFSLGGPSTCVAGFCGITIPFAIAVGVALTIAILGPGIIGIVVDISTTKSAGREAQS